MTDDEYVPPQATSIPLNAERKLAAILSTGVKGCCRLIGDDEEPTTTMRTTYPEIVSKRFPTVQWPRC